MPDQFRVAIGPSRSVTSIAYRATEHKRIGSTLILGHGAGAGQTSHFMVAFAAALAERGIDTVTFNFPYIEEGRRLPDPNARLGGLLPRSDRDRGKSNIRPETSDRREVDGRAYCFASRRQ